jgi:arylsulfatase A-like enzyme
MYPEVPLPETFDDPNIHKHEFLGPMFRKYVNSPLLKQTSEEVVKEFIRLTYGCVSMIDHSIGKILAALENLGYSENTMVVYTSDHGDLMGDHGIIFKGPSPFDGVLRVPLIIKAPGLSQPGRVTDALASSVDIAKTVLNYAGVKKRYYDRYIQGLDLAPVLENPESRVRYSCIIEEDEEMGKGLVVRLRHLVTEDYKISVYAGLENFGDIYDRKNDPSELNNLWYKEPELREKLFQKLFHEVLKAESKYPARQSAT